MRVVFVGASEHTLRTAKLLIERDHEVVIIEASTEKVDELSEQMDCSFLNGDGSKPQILREAGPGETDVLFCLTDDDQDNIIASLVGRTLGFGRVVTSIRDPEFEPICIELGLEDTIIPSRTIARYLADMVTGVDILELSTAIKGEARFFTLVAGNEEEGTVADLDLPARTRVICYYRGGEFALADPDSTLQEGDEVVLLTHSDHLSDLQDRFSPDRATGDGDAPEGEG